MLLPAVERPRLRRVWPAIFGIGFGAGLLATFALASTSQAPTPAPIVHVVPAAPSVVPVPVTVAAPQVNITQPAPVEPVLPDPPPVRAASPTLNAACIGESSEPDAACTWDTGFPAISHDGSTIAVQRVLDDGGRGYPSMYIELLDASTSKVTRTIKILSPDEYDPETGKHAAKVAQRTKTAQAAIDAIGFRSMVKITRDGEPSATGLYLEGEQGAWRIVDRDRGLAIWQESFPGKAAFPNMPAHDEMECNHPSAYEASVAWDPETRVVVATVHYQFGGCLCGGDSKTYVRRVR